VASRFAVLSSLFLAAVAFTGSLGLVTPLAHPEATSSVGDLAGAVAIAKTATAWQADTLGVTMPARVAMQAHVHPSEAVLVLAARHGVTPDATQAAQVAALDSLPAATALAGVIDAFLAVEDATSLAFAHADRSQLQQLADHPDQADGASLAGLGMDFAPIFTARGQLLDASLALANAWPLHAPSTASSAPPTLDLCPAIALDTVGVATAYPANCALTVDVGGDDTYTNNAGGSSVYSGPTGTTCFIDEGAGALLDLAGNDRYVAGRNCGVNGGGQGASGFLLDVAGNDTYAAGNGGINGGGSLGVGFLLDVLGSDTYTAGDSGTNGGGSLGSGLLIDLSGNDSYTATTRGVNGGTAEGVGLLLDGSGHDAYSDSDGGTGTDKTVAPKGTGAQVDVLEPQTLCPQGADPGHVGACGDVLCPTGVTSPPGPDQLAVVCGVPVDNPCPSPMGMPGPDQLAVICGEPVPNPCPTPMGMPGPDQIAVVCGEPVPNPCPTPMGMPGPDQIAVVCGEPVPNPCPTPVGMPGPDQLAVICGEPVPGLAGLAPQCSDGIDNDGDSRIDWAPTALQGQPVPWAPGKVFGDPACINAFGNRESP
jgi:hypothetical protein